ncbi:MAG: response regulator [Chloroflexota bacterium]
MNNTVLVIEDDRGLQQTIEGILELEGYDVILAGDGLEGLQRLEHRTVDLIVLDVMLPRMDGFAFADELRRRGMHSVIPILVLTADGRAREKAERIGAQAYLTKPFDLVELLHEVSQLIHP